MTGNPVKEQLCSALEHQYISCLKQSENQVNRDLISRVGYKISGELIHYNNNQIRLALGGGVGGVRIIRR